MFWNWRPRIWRKEILSTSICFKFEGQEFEGRKFFQQFSTIVWEEKKSKSKTKIVLRHRIQFSPRKKKRIKFQNKNCFVWDWELNSHIEKKNRGPTEVKRKHCWGYESVTKPAKFLHFTTQNQEPDSDYFQSNLTILYTREQTSNEYKGEARLYKSMVSGIFTIT